MKKIVLLLVISSIIMSCKSKGIISNDLYGTYKAKKGSFTLNLRKNIFSYRHVGGLYDSKSKGEWYLKNGNIYLNSYPNFKTDMIEVRELKNELKYKVINVKNEEGLPCVGCVLSFNNLNGQEEYIVVDESGIIELQKKIKLESFKVSFLGETYDYNIKNNQNNSFEVIVYSDNLNKTYFKNESININKRFLIINKKRLYKE